jgi:hypothetical protein
MYKDQLQGKKQEKENTKNTVFDEIKENEIAKVPENNQTWDLVQLPIGKRALHNKWVYRLKDEVGGKKRYRARLVVKGFAQKKV